MTKIAEAATLACQIALEKKGEEIVLLDVSKVSVFADYFLLVTARSRTQRRALAQAIWKTLDGFPLERRGMEGYPDSPWVLLDYYSIVVHIFGPEERDYYGLDGRWPEATVTKFEEGFVH